jgi:hypothetical protein
MKSLGILSWVGGAVSASVICEVVAYIRASDSNHTSFEPWVLVVIFVPTLVVGFVAIWERRSVLAGVLALLIGVAGLAILTYIDRTNTMVQYDRWLSRGMPLPHQPSRPSDIH